MSYLETIARNKDGLNAFLKKLRFAYKVNQHITWLAPLILAIIAVLAVHKGDYVVALLLVVPGANLFARIWYIQREVHDLMWQLILLRNHINAGTRSIREALVIEQIRESVRALNLMTQYVMSAGASCLLLAQVGFLTTLWMFFRPNFESSWLTIVLVLGLSLCGITFLASWTYRTRLKDTMHFLINNCNIRFQNYFQVRVEITPEQMATEVMAGNGDYQPNPEIRRRIRQASGPSSC